MFKEENDMAHVAMQKLNVHSDSMSMKQDGSVWKTGTFIPLFKSLPTDVLWWI